jgi:lipid-A-disaccharide synthase
MTAAAAAGRDGARARRIVLVAGEPSGDRHAARLATALLAEPALAGVTLCGVAGPLMRAAGVEPIARMEDVSVVGFTEVLGRLPALLSVRHAIERAIADPRTALFLPVDFPGMNLPLCRVARRRRVPVLYYIAPQAWAWGRGRVRALARDVDRLAVILPFEEEFFRGEGVAATHVGHPLVESLAPEQSRADFLAGLGLAEGEPYLALLPGSRDQEVARLGPPLLGALTALRRERPGVRAIVAAASPAHRLRLEAMIPPELAAAGAVLVVDGRTRETLAYARAAVVASGTATLECAALGTPLVIVYRMAGVSYGIARRLVRLPRARFGLANIVAGGDVAPELLQAAVTPSAIAGALKPLWDEGPERVRALERLATVRGRLGGPGASTRTAALAAELVARHRDGA